MKIIKFMFETLACAALGWGFVQAAILLHNLLHSY
jgi:hypothetical protein